MGNFDFAKGTLPSVQTGGLGRFFPDADVDVIVEILNDVTSHAVPAGA